MAHIFASMMFSLIALALASLIAAMLTQARVAIGAALGMAALDRLGRYRAPVRVEVRRTAAWSAPRQTGIRRAA